MSDATVRELAEHLARRLGVRAGRLELIFDENGRYTDGYWHERLRPKHLELLDALAGELLERAAIAGQD